MRKTTNMFPEDLKILANEIQNNSMTMWLHSPSHLFNAQGSYMVTAATLNKQHFFRNNPYLELLQTHLFQLASHYNWCLEAWAIFPNHYHFIAQSPSDPTTLRQLLTHLHANTARELNRLEQTPGRKVWYQYWDTQLTFEKSYLARLNYVINNPVRHKIVQNAEDYPWCSAKWFAQNATPTHYKTVSNFKTDTVQVIDDF